MFYPSYMKSFALNGVHHLMSKFIYEDLCLSCKIKCDWSSKLNGAKT